MPKEILLTYDLVRASPSERKGDHVIYHTPFGVVKEQNNGKLALWRQDKWISLENAHGQLLLRHGRDSIGLPPKTVYESTWDYIQARAKAYWWLLLLLIAASGIASTLNISQFWMSGIFISATAFVCYWERGKTGIRHAAICLIFGLATFLTVAFIIEITYAILQTLQVTMGLCDFWAEDCSSPRLWLQLSNPTEF